MIPARSFVRGFFTNALEDDELLTEIVVPKFDTMTRWGIYKSARRPGEFAESLAVVIAHEDDDGSRHIEAWLGAAADVPLRISGLCDRDGTAAMSLTSKEVHEAVQGSLASPTSQEERYRSHLHGVAMWRAVKSMGVNDE
ncbi:hypothetical protein GCM10027062_45350 [Nocardioides hungaricus]